MKLKEILSPEYQRRYAKAMRDWEAGRNLVEAAAIVYGTKSKKALAALVKLREEELASKRKKGASSVPFDRCGAVATPATKCRYLEDVGEARDCVRPA